VIGTAVVAASVAAGLVISGVPSRLLGPARTTGPATGSHTPALPTRSVIWPAASVKSAKGTAPMLRYVLTGFVRPGSTLELPSTRSVLLKLARTAGHRAPLPQRPGARISLVETNEWFLNTAVSGGKATSVITPEVDRNWFAPNGAWRLLSHRGRPEITAVGSLRTLRAAVYGPPTDTEHGQAGHDGVLPLVGHFSLDPTALRQQLLNADQGGAPLAIRLIETIRQLHDQVVSPQFDAAMWRVLATQPDVHYLGRVTDRAGRAGEAFAYTEKSGEREVLIISPTTGQLLGWEDLILHGAAGLNLTAYPAVVGYIAFVGQQWTNTLNGSGR
jgi:hypothetical protein